MRPGKVSQWEILFILSCLLVITLSGCGSSGARFISRTKAPDNQQVYRYADVSTDISTFDPGQATDQPSLEAITMVFTGLLQMDDRLQVRPQLAESYAASSDGLTYTFHLRHNLKFSDGTPLAANDVAYSIDRALSPAIANLNGVTLTYLGQIKGAADRVNGQISTLICQSIQVVDASTIRLVLRQKTAYFLEALTYPTSYVVEKSVIDKWGSKWTDHLNEHGGQGGDGPFKVQSYDHSKGIVFVPNPAYYGPQPQLQRVNFDFYKTADNAFQAYQAGQVDLVKGVPPSQLATARALPDRQYSQSSELSIDYIAMNYLYKPFDSIPMRQAFALAINKDVIARSIHRGTRIATCHIIPQGIAGYNPDLQCPGGAPTRGNLRKARQLFQQGLQEEGLTLATFPQVTITYQTNAPALDDAITSIRQQWQQALGVNVIARTENFVQRLTEANQTLCATPNDLARCQNQGLQMWVAGWIADYPDPQDWISLQFARGASNNQWNYGQNLSKAASTQQELQTSMVQADAELNQTRRLDSYKRIEQQLVNDVAWLPLDQRFSSNVLKPYVIGQIFNAMDLTPPNDWGNIYIAVH